jgi:hypothetical protein
MHYDKFTEPAEKITIAGSTLKWYNLAKEDEPVPDEINHLARTFLNNEDQAGNLKNFGEMGFVILHRCGADFYFLLVSSWKNGNELWESVYAKQNDAQADFEEFPLESPHHATFCVWELAAVWHEQQAWKRFLLSSQDEKAKANYLADLYRGIS